jgi:hypothetical protein
VGFTALEEEQLASQARIASQEKDWQHFVESVKNDNVSGQPFPDEEVTTISKAFQQIVLVEKQQKRQSNVSMIHFIRIGEKLNNLMSFYGNKTSIYKICKSAYNVSFYASYAYFLMDLQAAYVKYPRIARSTCSMHFLLAKMSFLKKRLNLIVDKGSEEVKQFWRIPWSFNS